MTLLSRKGVLLGGSGHVIYSSRRRAAVFLASARKGKQRKGN